MGIKAQDTTELCKPLPPYSGTVTSLSHLWCGTVFATFVINGDTIHENTFPFSTNVTVGTPGMMSIYCSAQITGTPDTVVYFIRNSLPQICFITSDTNNHAVIYVDSSSLIGNYAISLQRQVTTLSWHTVASFAANDTLVFIDTTANTVAQSYTYRLVTTSCIGYSHTAIHLQSNGSNLSWNQYVGGSSPLRGYYIYKRVGANFMLIDSTSGLTYTDVNYQNGDEYQVEAFKDDICQSNAWRSTGAPLSVRSNKLKIGASGIEEQEQNLLRYYVEGTILYVELKKADDIRVHDIIGREITNQHTAKFNIPLPSGVYVLNVGTKGYKVLIR